MEANNENKGKSLAELFDGPSWREWLFKAKAFFTRHDVLECMFIDNPEVEGRRFIEETSGKFHAPPGPPGVSGARCVLWAVW
jgi:hypothetical protein